MSALQQPRYLRRPGGPMGQAAAGHGAGCDGLLRGHIERVAGDGCGYRGDRFRVVMRCACSRNARIVSDKFARFETAQSVLRQIEFR